MMKYVMVIVLVFVFIEDNLYQNVTMSTQFANITTTGARRGTAVHAQVSRDILNGTTTPITSEIGLGYTPDYPVSIDLRTLWADAVKIDDDSITIVEIKTGKLNLRKAREQTIRYAYGINAVFPRDTIHVIIIAVDADQSIRFTLSSADVIKEYLK